MNDRNAKIVRLYKNGLLIKDIAAAVGMAANSICGILRKQGIERPKKPQKRWAGAVDEDKVAELWGIGLCVSQISERLSIPRTTAANILSKQNLTNALTPRHRYDAGAVGGSGRSGFAASMARRT